MTVVTEHRDTPLVSVILPVYNGEPYLREAIDSILQQDYPNFELIIIDDGSTDSSWNVIQAIQEQDSRVRTYSQENCGLPYTLNRGIELAKGEFVARIDQDDRSFPNRLSTQVTFLQAHPQIGIVGSAYQIINPTNEIIGVHYPLCSPHQIKRQLFVGNPFCHGTVMIRKSIVLSIGGYGTTSSIEDYELWSRLAHVTRMANLPHVLYDYRVNVSTSMVAVNKQQYRIETDKIRRWMWSEGTPPPIWDNAHSLFHGIRRENGYFTNEPRIPTGIHGRSQRKLHVWVGLDIARRYWQMGKRKCAMVEWLSLVLIHITRPIKIVRLLYFLPTIFTKSVEEKRFYGLPG